MTYFFIAFVFKLMNKLLNHETFRKIKLAGSGFYIGTPTKDLFHRVVFYEFVTGIRKIVKTAKAKQVTFINKVAAATRAGMRKE